MLDEIIKQGLGLVLKKVEDPENLRVGDHIYTYRRYGSYSHHGIYVGDGKVIHYTRTESKEPVVPNFVKSGQQSEPPARCEECQYHETLHRGVVKTCLDCFRRGQWKRHSIHYYAYGVSELLVQMKMVPGTCTTLKADKTPEEVVAAAEEMLSTNGFGKYDLENNNCEHFAIYCKTGLKRSEQILFWTQVRARVGEAGDWVKRTSHS